MKIIKLIILLFLFNNCFGQANLIQNGSFEQGETDEPRAPCKTGQFPILQVWTNDFTDPSGNCYNTCNPTTFNPDWCTCLGCDNEGGFHSTDWLRFDPQNPFLPFTHVQEDNCINIDALTPCGINIPTTYGIPARTGLCYVGMGPSELFEQKFSNSAPMIAGKTYVLSMYIRIPRPAQNFSNPNQQFVKSFIQSGCYQQLQDNNINRNVTSTTNIPLNVYLATSKIEYLNNFLIDCNSSQSSGKKTNNTSVKIWQFNLNTVDYPYYQWHHLTVEFSTAQQYNWIAFELDDVQLNDEEPDQDPYILIDDVTLNEKCVLGCTKTSGIPDPQITSFNAQNNPDCMGAIISNISNVQDIKIEVYDLSNSPNLIRTQEFFNTNGFSGPVYWDGFTSAPSPAAGGYYAVKATCINDCGTFTFSAIVLNPGCAGDSPSLPNPPASVITNTVYNDCCQIDLTFTNETFTSFNSVTHPYFYRPENNIYINSCDFTNISNSTFEAGIEIDITGETVISPGVNQFQNSFPEFHALIVPCVNAHRDSQPTNVLTDKDFIISYGDVSPNKQVNLQQNPQQNLSVSPNPSNGIYQILGASDIKIDKIIIHGIIGNTIDEFIDTRLIDIKSYSPGIYFAEIIYGNSNVVLKLIHE